LGVYAVNEAKPEYEAGHFMAAAIGKSEEIVKILKNHQ